MKTIRPLTIATLAASVLLPASTLAEDSGWYLRAHGGISELGDTDGEGRGIDGLDGSVDVETDSGFFAGAAAGYRYSPRWSVEIAWEYRSNDAETVAPGGNVYPDGNYASNTLFLNGMYHFDARGRWDPYVGAGIGWQQEIDIDLEGLGAELSYSGDDSFGLQLFGGVNYQLSERWALNGELRYGQFDNIDLEGESGAPGEIESLDYTPLSAQFGVIYRF
ncbi:MAG: OmpW family outer membrane protein [Pseudomonadota bacterium]